MSFAASSGVSFPPNEAIVSGPGTRPPWKRGRGWPVYIPLIPPGIPSLFPRSFGKLRAGGVFSLVGRRQRLSSASHLSRGLSALVASSWVSEVNWRTGRLLLRFFCFFQEILQELHVQIGVPEPLRTQSPISNLSPWLRWCSRCNSALRL